MEVGNLKYEFTRTENGSLDFTISECTISLMKQHVR